MGKIIDLTGQTFTRLTVLKLDDTKETTRGAFWICECSCGNVKSIHSSSLRSQLTKSCGCIRAEETGARALARGNCFGESKSRMYSIWGAMLNKCANLTDKNYGGKGIAVCTDWLDYMSFKNWALANGYSDNLSIDRVDNAKGYSPDNCRWVSILIQARNRSKSDKASSKYFGVLLTKSGTFQALVQIKGKKVFCKTFKDEIEAAKARDNYIITNKLEGYSFNF
jgi:hypothetical protein